MAKYLDSIGLSHLISKIKTWATGLFVSKSGDTMSGTLGIGNNTQNSIVNAGLKVNDVRSADLTPSSVEYAANFFFYYGSTMPTNMWWSLLHVKGWGNGYSAWELAGPANNSDQRTTPLYVRSSNGTSAWGNWRKIFDDAQTIPISNGGTGATTAAAAWTALGGGSVGKKNSLSRSDISDLVTATTTSEGLLAWDGEDLDGEWGPLGATISNGAITLNGYILQASDIPFLPASKINSGTLAAARLPDASTSSKGAMTSAMVTKLNGITDSADAVSFTRTQTSGTKIGTITINGSGTDIYAPAGGGSYDLDGDIAVRATEPLSALWYEGEDEEIVHADGPLPIDYGGTGAASAASALANLGIGQACDCTAFTATTITAQSTDTKIPMTAISHNTSTNFFTYDSASKGLKILKAGTYLLQVSITCNTATSTDLMGLSVKNNAGNTVFGPHYARMGGSYDMVSTPLRLITNVGANTIWTLYGRNNSAARGTFNAGAFTIVKIA